MPPAFQRCGFCGLKFKPGDTVALEDNGTAGGERGGEVNLYHAKVYDGNYKKDCSIKEQLSHIPRVIHMRQLGKVDSLGRVVDFHNNKQVLLE
jgi:hypothetical protein